MRLKPFIFSILLFFSTVFYLLMSFKLSAQEVNKSYLVQQEALSQGAFLEKKKHYYSKALNENRLKYIHKPLLEDVIESKPSTFDGLSLSKDTSGKSLEASRHFEVVKNLSDMDLILNFLEANQD